MKDHVIFHLSGLLKISGRLSVMHGFELFIRFIHLAF